jgi:hypothetical protein
MRARNMQSLTDAIKARFPGATVYGVGDAAHRLRTSDHNEDDTAGSKAAQSDADSTPEHRAIDIMLGSAFTRAQAYALIADLLADPAALRRLKYIIFDGWIWSRTNSWRKVAFDGDDKHRDHPHISGDAADDENAAGWPAVEEGDDMTPAQAYVQHVMNYRLDAIRGNKATIKVPKFGDYAEFVETNQLAVALTALASKPTADVDEAALAAALGPLLETGATPAEVAAAVVATLATKLASTGG